jgi:hypothetical protein
MVSVVIPTIQGREKWLDACMSAYEETCADVELIVIRDRTSCGQAWIDGAAEATGEYLHFTADDLAPLPGWWEAAAAVADEGGVPGANVLTAQDPDGSWREDSTMFSGAFLNGDRDARNILVPFLSRKIFEEGGWLLPIHYGSDDWVTFLADVRKHPIPFTADYKFTHGAAPEGRLWDSRRVDIPVLCDAMAEHGAVPWSYQRMGLEYDWVAA